MAVARTGVTTWSESHCLVTVGFLWIKDSLVSMTRTSIRTKAYQSLPFTEHNVIVISESSSLDGLASLHVVGLMVGPFAELFSLVLSVLCFWLLCRLTHTDMNC